MELVNRGVANVTFEDAVEGEQGLLDRLRAARSRRMKNVYMRVTRKHINPGSHGSPWLPCWLSIRNQANEIFVYR